MFRRLRRFLTSKLFAKRRAAARWDSLVRQDEQGQSAVEMALCLPVMLLVVTGITSFGIAMNNYLLVTNGTNAGARMVALARGVTTDPCADVVRTVTNAAPLLRSNNLTYSLAITPQGGSTPTTTSSGGNSWSCTGAASSLTANATVQITVNYPCALKVYGRDLAPNCSMQGTDAELVQ